MPSQAQCADHAAARRPAQTSTKYLTPNQTPSHKTKIDGSMPTGPGFCAGTSCVLLNANLKGAHLASCPRPIIQGPSSGTLPSAIMPSTTSLSCRFMWLRSFHRRTVASCSSFSATHLCPPSDLGPPGSLLCTAVLDGIRARSRNQVGSARSDLEFPAREHVLRKCG